MDFIKIYLFCFLTCYCIFSYGHAINKVLFKFKINSIAELIILGFIFLSFLALFLNFFISLNVYLNTFIFFISFIFLFISKNSIDFINVTKKIAIISLIGFVTFLLDHSNRPDAGLYHLPYISMLNEEKIILGSVNLHFRFGHISSLQYLYAIFNNLILSDNGILIPLTLIFPTISIYFYEELKINHNITLKLFSIFSLVFILSTMNRYSGFGNDDPAHMIYLLSTYNIMKLFIIKNEDPKKIYNKIVLYCINTFLIKQFYVLILVFPLIVFIANFKKINLFTKPNIFSTFFILLWLFKNILISSCVLYPVNLTCIKSLEWSPIGTISDSKKVSLSSEAWAKAYPDRINKSKGYREHISDYEWIKGWMNTHSKVVIKKILPLLIFSILIILFCYATLEYRKKVKTKKIILIIFVINLIFLLFWFFKFPTYRYGAAYLGTSIILSSIIILNRFNIKHNIRKIFTYTLILLCFLLTLKNFNRIFKNLDTKYIDYPWPKKNSFTSSNKKNTNIPRIQDKEIIYYTASPYTLCMYSKAPCTSFKNLKLKRIIYPWNYKVLIAN